MGAVLSDCGGYRYVLWRDWAAGPRALFILLNPSTADATQDDPVAAWHIVCDELSEYGAALDEKPQIVALNKGDLLDPELMADIAEQLHAAGAQDVIAISGATGQGVDLVLDRVLEALPAKSGIEGAKADGITEDGTWSPI
jgi:GTP-binding protein